MSIYFCFYALQTCISQKMVVNLHFVRRGLPLDMLFFGFVRRCEMLKFLHLQSLPYNAEYSSVRLEHCDDYIVTGCRT